MRKKRRAQQLQSRAGADQQYLRVAGEQSVQFGRFPLRNRRWTPVGLQATARQDKARDVYRFIDAHFTWPVTPDGVADFVVERVFGYLHAVAFVRSVSGSRLC